MKVSVVILAGGTGSRMKTDLPKQFIEIDGVPVIVNTINNFQKNERIDNITVVCLLRSKFMTQSLLPKINNQEIHKLNAVKS